MNELYNKKHGITESEVLRCEDSNKLHSWHVDVKKDLVELEGKYTHLLGNSADPNDIKRMCHALNMQRLLCDVIENRIREIEHSSDADFNRVFVDVSRQLLTVTLFDEVIHEVEKRITI